MRRISQRCLSAVAGLAAALVVAPPASAATSTPYGRPDTQQRTLVFQLVAKQTQSESLDLGKKGLSRGDELVIAEDLYRDGRRIGDHSVVCVHVHLDPDELQCVGTFALPQGQITSQALLHLPPAPSIDIAVTGGSGAFSSARGYVHTVPAGKTVRNLTFHLTLDASSGT
ncbi:hypothetical protein ACFWAN_05960 [Streptomyces mirabilis]|uniref:allene oxide cyclase barrel-like domain-containing protein n=1 Tax=Streptomyces mirabilis TaxID=68239 RepID=UPI0036571021